MAGGQFIDYKETGKPGLYQFRDTSGSSRLLYGTAAEQIKEGIDRGRKSALGALGEGNMKPDEWNALAGPYNEQAKAPEAVPDQRTADNSWVSDWKKSSTDPEAAGLQRGRPNLQPMKILGENQLGGDLQVNTRANPGAGANPGLVIEDVNPEKQQGGAYQVSPTQAALFGQNLQQVEQTQGEGRVAPGAKYQTKAKPTNQSPVPELTPEQEAKFRSRTPQQGGQPGQQVEGKPVEVLDSFQGKNGEVYQKVVGSDGKTFWQAYSPARGPTRGTPGGMRPSTTTVAGQKQAPSEHYFEARNDITTGIQEGVRAEADATAQASEGTVDTLQRQNEDLFNQQMQAIYSQRAMEAAQQKAQESLQEYEKKIAEYQINPDRIYAGEEGKARKTRHAVKAFFGGIAASLGHRPNLVVEAIKQMRENDIKAQESELRSAEGNRDSALQHFKHLTGSVETAKDAVRVLQNNRYIVQLKQEMARAQTPAARAAAKQTIAQLERENLDYTERFKQDTAGTVSKSYQYVPGRPGSPGKPATTRLLTPDEAKSVAGADKAINPQGGGAGAGVAASQAATAIGFRASLGALRQRLESHGAKDPESMKKNMNESLLGKIARFPFNAAQEGLGYKMPIVGWSDKELREHQDFLAARQMAVGMVTNVTGAGAPSGGEWDNVVKAMTTAGSYEELARYLAIADDLVGARIKALDQFSGKGGQAEVQFGGGFTPGFDPVTGNPK